MGFSDGFLGEPEVFARGGIILTRIWLTPSTLPHEDQASCPPAPRSLFLEFPTANAAAKNFRSLLEQIEMTQSEVRG